MDVVTLGAALSIMKKMPDTAASSAAAAEDAADRAEAAAEQAEGAIEVDDTLSVEGRAADAKVTGVSLKLIKQSVMDIIQNIETNFLTEFVCGVLSGSTGEIDTSSNKQYRVVSKDVLKTNENIIINVEAGYRIYIVYYDENGNFLNNSGWFSTEYTINKGLYYRIQIAKAERDEVIGSIASIAEFVSKVFYKSDLKLSVDKIKNIDYLINSTVFRNGSIGNIANANAIATTNVIPTNGARAIKVFVNMPLSDPLNHYMIQYTTYDVDSGITGNATRANRIVIDKNISGPVFHIPILNSEKGFGFGIFEVTPDETRIPVRIDNFDQKSVFFIYDYADSGNSELHDYVVGSDMQKKYINVQQIGTLARIQAFVKYNGNYISVVEGKITKQDSSFSIIETQDISIGHANSLQRGSGNLAYASGWNDNTVYIVNLDTLTVTGLITLPTTGYTTAVVDDVRKLAYIFQSDATSTWQSWNFIVYDYQSETVVATYKTIPFANIQGVDLLNDRIVLMHGMGTVASPSGMHVFNTRGECIADYILTTVPNTVEYEGVYIDRDDHTLYISDVGAHVYKIF